MTEEVESHEAVQARDITEQQHQQQAAKEGAASGYGPKGCMR